MGDWKSSRSFQRGPAAGARAADDPDAARTWSPIDFTLEDLDGDRLQTGDIAHVAGNLAGRRMSFDSRSFKASDGRLVLRASGPVKIDVDYGVQERDDGSGEITAWIKVSSLGRPDRPAGRERDRRRARRGSARGDRQADRDCGGGRPGLT